MKITVIGCGRWGSFIAYYLDTLGHNVTLYGREASENFRGFLETRSNGLLTLGENVALTSDIRSALDAEAVVISINSQGLRGLCGELASVGLRDKYIVLCMKGLEIGTGCRLSEVVAQTLDPSNRTAVWIGPGHVQEFLCGILILCLRS